MAPFQPEALYRWTQRTEDQLGDVAGAAFRASDELQRSAVDLLFRLVTFQSFGVEELGGLSSQISEAASLFESAEERKVAEQQVRNTIEVFNLVKNVRQLLAEPAVGELPLPDLVRKAYTLGEYPALWAIEGLGHDYAERVWSGQHGDPQDLLTSGLARMAPDSSLAMLHAGIGLYFAERLLKTVTPYSRGAEVSEMLWHFIRLCQRNSRPGYTGCSLESLGLVTRTWHPQIVKLIDRNLQQMSDEALGYFWHGVGRALYFAPTHLVPELYSPWFAVDSDPPHELGRMNARAGLAWATTLVNLRRPEILESLLRKRERFLTEDDAFANGVAASIAMASDVTPQNSIVASFLKYKPRSTCCTAKVWESHVRWPAEQAFRRYQPLLRSRGHIEELFRYQPLPELARRLENTGGAE